MDKYISNGKCQFRFLSNLRRIGPLAAFILMLALLLQLIYLMRTTYVSIPNLITSNPFIHGFQYPAGPILKWYNLGTMFITMAIPYTVIARSLTHRNTRFAYWSYVIPTVAFCLYLLIIWTIPFSWLIQYINDMGSTPKRIHGLWYGLAGYVVIMGFLFWAIRKPSQKNPESEIDNVEEQHCEIGKR